MVLEKLSDSLKGTLQKIAKALFVDDTVLNELIKDIQRALLNADVNVKLVFDLTNSIKVRAREEPAKGLTKREQLINIVYEELVKFLGSEKKEIGEGKQKIMLVGLFGSGKTTTAGKLAKYCMKRGKRVALLGLDIHRPAAMDQIEQVAKQINATVFVEKKIKDPVAIYEKFKKDLEAFDIIIIDTAGRDALNEDLIEELDKLTHVIQPTESLLVISADIGQAAQKQAQTFHDTCHITGVIITKMDGTAKGGGALSACAVTGAPIKFIGVGEKVDDFEAFNPKGFVGRLLGMGDLEALLEKAKEAMTEEEAQDVEKKFLSGEFTLIDLYQQMEALNKMGSLGKLMEMIPGMGQLQLPKDALHVQEGKLEQWKHAMNSMTKKELENPEVIDANRIDRIAKGSGIDASEIRDLIKQHRQGKKLVKMLKGADSPEKLMKKFKGKLPKMF